MKIAVTDAREIAQALTSAADAAEAAGQQEFDLLDTLQGVDNAARDVLAAAIAAKEGH